MKSSLLHHLVTHQKCVKSDGHKVHATPFAFWYQLTQPELNTVVFIFSTSMSWNSWYGFCLTSMVLALALTTSLMQEMAKLHWHSIMLIYK